MRADVPQSWPPDDESEVEYSTIPVSPSPDHLLDPCSPLPGQVQAPVLAHNTNGAIVDNVQLPEIDSNAQNITSVLLRW